MKPKELIRAKALFREGDFNAALELVNSFEENKGIIPKDLLSSHLIKSLLLIKLGNCKEGFKYAEMAYQESQDLRKDLRSVDASILMSRALWRLMKLDDALEVIGQGEKLLRSIILPGTVGGGVTVYILKIPLFPYQISVFRRLF